MPCPLVSIFDARIRANNVPAEQKAGAATTDLGGPQPPVTSKRSKGRKRAHNQGTIAAVRHLIEETTLPYEDIATKTGVANGTISKWMHDFGWRRHPYAPVATDALPPARAGRKLKLRILGNRLHLLAERCATEMWNSPAADLDQLLQAMRVLRTARHDYMSHRRPRGLPDSPAYTGQEWTDHEAAIRTALADMRRAGITIERIPYEAMALLDDTQACRDATTRRPGHRHPAHALSSPPLQFSADRRC